MPSAAPMIPVKIVIIAVSDGTPPIISEMPIAIGAVTFLGSNVFIVIMSRPRKNAIAYVTLMAKNTPRKTETSIAFLASKTIFQLR